jgi:lysyl-tRNA synthetase, class II
VFGSPVIRQVDGSDHDLGGQWRAVTLYRTVAEAVGFDVTPDTPVEDLRKLGEAHAISHSRLGR